MSERRCVVCGGSLEDRRPQTITCDAICRRTLSRVRHIVGLLGDGRYGTLADLPQWSPKPCKRGEDDARREELAVV